MSKPAKDRAKGSGGAGRPSRYKQEYAEQVEKLCKLGATDKEIADFFGVTEQTINNWKRSHPQFFESIKKGKLLADAEVADKLFQRATGYSHAAQKFFQFQGAVVVQDYTEHYPPETAAGIWWLKNRRRQDWSGAQRDDGEGDELSDPNPDV